MSVITLKPEVNFFGERLPTREQIDDMHHAAHNECFIANSVKSEVRCEPVYGALKPATQEGPTQAAYHDQQHSNRRAKTQTSISDVARG